jgi:hypothetical protein
MPAYLGYINHDLTLFRTSPRGDEICVLRRILQRVQHHAYQGVNTTATFNFGDAEQTNPAFGRSAVCGPTRTA